MKRIAILLALLSISCGASVQEKRNSCYDALEAAHEVRVDTLCPGGGKAWDACPHRKALLDELQISYRKCP